MASGTTQGDYGYKALDEFMQVGRGTQPGPVLCFPFACGFTETPNTSIANGVILPFQSRPGATADTPIALLVGFAASFYHTTTADFACTVGIGPSTSIGAKSPTPVHSWNIVDDASSGTQGCWTLGREKGGVATIDQPVFKNATGVVVPPLFTGTNNTIFTDFTSTTAITHATFLFFIQPLTHIQNDPARD